MAIENTASRNTINETGKIQISSGPDEKKEGDILIYESPDFGNRSRSNIFIKKILGSFGAYGSSFLSVCMFFPILALIATTGLYFYGSAHIPSWQVLTNGFLSAAVVILFVALLASPSATAQGANVQGYNDLKSEQEELSARLNVSKPDSFKIFQQQVIANFGLDHLEGHHKTAIREAYAFFFAASKSLSSLSGPQWVSGAGYAYTWKMIHRSQEALIEVEPIPAVIGEAMQDQVRLLGSRIKQSNELLEKLHLAVKHLVPESVQYLRDVTTARINQVGYNLSSTSLDPLMKATARVAIRDVKHSLNIFQEDRLIALVQARNNLTLSILASGLATYLILSMAILSFPGNPGPILPAVVFYIVGTAAGLFGRLYAESQTSSAINDYGLSLRRVIAVPLISGLAAIGGVFLVAVLPSTSANASGSMPTIALSLDKILVLSPYNLLIAAIFGLTPNLLIKGLKKYSDEALSDLASTSLTNAQERVN